MGEQQLKSYRRDTEYILLVGEQQVRGDPRHTGVIVHCYQAPLGLQVLRSVTLLPLPVIFGDKLTRLTPVLAGEGIAQVGRRAA